jgi:hypothetical protein
MQPDSGYDESLDPIGSTLTEQLIDQGHLGRTTVVDHIDPTQVFPMETEADLEKLETRINAWYELLGKIHELQQHPKFRLVPTNRLGQQARAIEYYLHVLTIQKDPQHPDVKAAHADIARVQQELDGLRTSVRIILEQSEMGQDLFTGVLSQAEDILHSWPSHDSADRVYKHLKADANIRRFSISDIRVELVNTRGLNFPYEEDAPALGISHALTWVNEQIEDQQNLLAQDGKRIL